MHRAGCTPLRDLVPFSTFGDVVFLVPLDNPSSNTLILVDRHMYSDYKRDLSQSVFRLTRTMSFQPLNQGNMYDCRFSTGVNVNCMTLE